MDLLYLTLFSKRNNVYLGLIRIINLNRKNVLIYNREKLIVNQ